MSYTARATRYTSRYTSAVTWPKKPSLEKVVSLDLSLQRHLTGPLEARYKISFGAYHNISGKQIAS